MSIPSHLSGYLGQRGARYEICSHEHSGSSTETACAACIPAHQLAKSVVLEDDAGCVMAVIPADRTLSIDDFGHLLGRHRLKLANEARIALLFKDCDAGAIPPVGMAWGVETVVDAALEECNVVFMEAGDHESLLRMSHDQFHELMRTQPHGHFCQLRAH